MCQPIIHLNQEGHRLTKIMKILFFIYLFIIVGKIILKDYKGALTDFLCILILLTTFMCCHFILAAFLIFMVILSLFYSIIFLGLRVQNKLANLNDVYLKDDVSYVSVIVIQGLSLIFYIFLIYYSFQSYKEYKAILVNGGGYRMKK